MVFRWSHARLRTFIFSAKSDDAKLPEVKMRSCDSTAKCEDAKKTTYRLRFMSEWAETDFDETLLEFEESYLFLSRKLERTGI